MAFDLPYLLLSAVSILAHTVSPSNYHVNCLLKCLPIIFAIVYLNSHRAVGSRVYGRRITLALIASFVGDIFIEYHRSVWPDALLYGTLSFGLAHLLFISAFGLKPFSWTRLVMVVIFHLASVVLIAEPLSNMG